MPQAFGHHVQEEGRQSRPAYSVSTLVLCTAPLHAGWGTSRRAAGVRSLRPEPQQLWPEPLGTGSWLRTHRATLRWVGQSRTGTWLMASRQMQGTRAARRKVPRAPSGSCTRRRKPPAPREQSGV